MGDETAPREAPARVRRAVVLLWVALALAIAQFVFDAQVLEMKIESGLDLVFGAFVVFSYGITAALIHFTGRGKNWARMLLLLATLAGTALMLFPWGEGYFESWTARDIASAAAFSILDFVALYWLFTGEANAWFRRRPAG